MAVKRSPYDQGWLDGYNQYAREQLARDARDSKLDSACGKLQAALDQLTLIARIREYVQHVSDSVSAARKSREPQTGMHVPYHGDFAGANPTVLRELERMVRHFQDLLGASTEKEQE